MAMFLAHQNEDVQTPSFFELVMQHRMSAELYPAFRHIVEALARTFPQYVKYSEHSEEIYGLIVFLVERHYLSRYDATFTESFYGLKRMKAGPLGQVSALSNQDRAKSLLLVVLLPYLKSQLEKYFRRITTTSSSDQELSATPLPLEWASHFKRAFPVLFAIGESTSTIYQIMFLFNKTRYFSPVLHLLGIVYARRTMDDAKLAENMERIYREGVLTQCSKPGIVNGFKKLFYQLRFSFVDSVSYLLVGAIIGYKALEWWNNYRQEAQAKAMITGFVPPPPEPLQHVEAPDEGKEDMCFICGRTRTNPCVSPFGYLYCYPCLFEYVKDYKLCPRAQLPCTTADIRKLYES